MSGSSVAKHTRRGHLFWGCKDKWAQPPRGVILLFHMNPGHSSLESRTEHIEVFDVYGEKGGLLGPPKTCQCVIDLSRFE